uniref:Uncharacterized protein n=1 Tax=Oryza punctata TaxID=4537 RepID=A0A0E0JI17_ORYPU
MSGWLLLMLIAVNYWPPSSKWLDQVVHKGGRYHCRAERWSALAGSNQPPSLWRPDLVMTKKENRKRKRRRRRSALNTHKWRPGDGDEVTCAGIGGDLEQPCSLLELQGGGVGLAIEWTTKGLWPPFLLPEMIKATEKYESGQNVGRSAPQRIEIWEHIKKALNRTHMMTRTTLNESWTMRELVARSAPPMLGLHVAGLAAARAAE